MSVTQTLMGPGSFSVSWRERLPQSIRNKVEPHDYVCIGPKGLTDLGLDDTALRAAIKAAKGYSGVILTIDNDGITGMDLMWRLGAGGEPAPIVDAPIVRSSSTNTSTWLDQILPCDNITKGAVTNGTSFSGVTSGLESRYNILNWICDTSDVEWILRADGTIDVGPSTTLFPAPTATSATVITRDPSGDEGGLSGVEATDVDLLRDGTSTASRVLVLHSGPAAGINFSSATQTPTGVRWKDWTGSTPSARTIVAEGLALRAARASQVASNMIGRLAQDQRAVTLTSRTHNVTADVTPGERVYVYDLESGLFDTANQVTWRGEPISPIVMRVAGLTWPIDDSRGVYLRVDGGNEWIDVTNYVAVESSDVAWDITVAGRRRNRSPISAGVVTIAMPGDKGVGSGGTNRQAAVGRTESSADVGGWTPTWSNITAGTGGSPLNEGYYTVSGGEMRLRAVIRLGNTGTVTGNPTIALPSGWEVRTVVTAFGDYLGNCRLTCAGNLNVGVVVRENATSISVRHQQVTGSRVVPADVSATSPQTWTAGDIVLVNVTIPVQPT